VNPVKPIIGILMLDTRFPRIPGDIGNPQTFAFPVIHQVVAGVTPQDVVLAPTQALIAPFIAAGHQLVARGAQAIATSCGFLALFHRHLVAALPVPVFSSSLLQAHLAAAVLGQDQRIGIMTAHQKSLTPAHLAGVGIQNLPLVIVGMDDAPEFNAVFIGGKPTLDVAKCRQEMQTAAAALIQTHPHVGAIVLECTNMPPYADVVRQVTGRPVFDVVTMLAHVYAALSANRFGDR